MLKKVVSDIQNKRESYTQDTIVNAVSPLLEEYNYRVPVPIVEMIREAGFKVYSIKLVDHINGIIVKSNEPEIRKKFKTDKVIIVNDTIPANRKLFTMAHEFGHYLLDPRASLDKFYNAFDSNSSSDEGIEGLCNRFAAELLMPKDTFVSQYRRVAKNNRNEDDISEILADYFNVPIKAVKKRLLEVKLNG